MNDYIKDNLAEVRSAIDSTLNKANISKDQVTLIAVSKTKPVEDLMVAYNEGVRDFGENKVQELTMKYEECPKDIRFHMIGHLQKNKVKYLINKAYLIHGVDSLELAKVIDKESLKQNTVTNILIEVNMAKEESKFGVYEEDVIELVKNISELKNVKIKGLMTIAPYVENAEDNRVYFKGLKKLSIDINNQNIDNVDMEILSMGMSGDYQVAIEEGATYVRVGTSIFGARNYNVGE